MYASPHREAPQKDCDFRQIFAVDENNSGRECVRTMDTTPDDPVLRDCRRLELARRLIAHQARTQTITALTNLSRHQLAQLRQRSRTPETTRHRGPSPRSLVRFTHSPRARGEAAALAAFCRAYRVLPVHPLRRSQFTLEFGERLCATYEAYRACFPQTDVTVEELFSLVLGVAENSEIGLGCCALCGGTVLVDRLARRGSTCIHCEGVLADEQRSVVDDVARDTPE